MKIKKKKNASLLFKWLLSYLMVFIIPVTAGVFIYLSSARVIREDIDSISSYILTQIQLSFDNITNQVYTLAHQLALDSEIEILMAKDSFSVKDRLLIKKVVERCLEYQVTATRVDDYCVYLKNSDSIIKPGGFYESTDINSIIPMENVDKSITWEDIKNGKYNNKVFKYAYVSNMNEFSESITYCVSVPLYGVESEGIILISVDLERYRDIAVKIYDGSDFAILDSNYNLLFSTMSVEAEKELSEKYIDDEKKIEILGKNCRLIELYSGVNNLRYLSITAEDTEFHKLSYVSKIMVVALLICILAGVLCAVYFSKKHYRPIQKILSLLAGQKLLKSSEDFVEDKIMFDAISRLLAEKNESEIKLYKQQEYVRTSVISKIINKGFANNITRESLMAMCDIDFEYDSFLVLCFHIYESEDIFADDYETRLFVVKNIFEELLNQNYTAYICEVNGYACAVVNFSGKKSENIKTELKEILESGKRVVSNNFNTDLAIACSNSKDSILAISECFQEAQETIKNLIFKQSNDIGFYDETNYNINGGEEYYFPIIKEQQFIDCIKRGDSTAAKNVIEDILSHYENGKVSVNIIGILTNDIGAALYKAANGMEEIPFSNINSIQTGILTKNLQSFKEEAFVAIDNIVNLIQASRHENESILVEKIKNIINTQYNDINLNVSYIANELELNSNYLSHVFAKQTGDGLLNYINKFRVLMSKELLKNKKLSVESISAMVGFTSSNSFIRVFKKFEGITPGKFREIEN